MDNEWVTKEGERPFPPTFHKTFLPKFPPNNTECQPRSGIYCDSLSVLALCLWPHVHLLLHCDSRAMSVPVPPGGTHCLGMPSMETPWLLVQNAGARLPEVAPKRAWKGVYRDFSSVECGGMFAGDDLSSKYSTCTLTARVDPAWTRLHGTFHSISHTTLFILHDIDTHNSNLSKEWSVARLFTVCTVLNMCPACIVWT